MATSLVLSLRKRLPRFRIGSFRGFRIAHSAAGVLLLFGVATHTGLRLGRGLDACLMLACLASVVLGAAAALATALEARLPAGVGAVVRRRCNRLHVYAMWPLPLLLTFHVVRFYYF
jgi:nitrite reductase (NADH) large subunit